MKSASGKRPPDEAHGPGKETIGPQQCSGAWGGRERKVRKARCTNHFCTTLDSNVSACFVSFRKCLENESDLKQFSLFDRSLKFQTVAHVFCSCFQRWPSFVVGIFWDGFSRLFHLGFRLLHSSKLYIFRFSDFFH